MKRRVCKVVLLTTSGEMWAVILGDTVAVPILLWEWAVLAALIQSDEDLLSQYHTFDYMPVSSLCAGVAA